MQLAPCLSVLIARLRRVCGMATTLDAAKGVLRRGVIGVRSSRSPLDALEPRVLLANVQWINGSGGFWDEPSNWDGGAVPGILDDVTIPSGGGAVIVRQEANSVRTLTTLRNMDFSGGTFTATTAFDIDGGQVVLRGGRISDTTIFVDPASGGIRATETDSRFERVTLNGDMDLSNADRGDGYYGYLVVNGGLTLNGTLMVGTESRLRIEGDQAITTTSSGVILMDSVQDVPWYLSRIELAGDTTATIASGITIRQSRGYGYIGEGWYGSGGRGQRLINQGTIEVVSPGRALSVGQYMEGVTNASSGVLSASGARLEVHGLTGNVETLSVTGGSAEFYGGSYAINRPLTIPSGVDIAFGGSWTNASTITVNGGGLWIGTSNGEWYSRDQLGTIVRNGGTVTLRGTIDQDLPLPPTGLAINATASNFVILTWNDGSYNERGFAIERSTDGGATFAQIGTTAANVTRYADTTVAASTAYVYRVRAYNAYGSSTHSDSVAATTAASGTTSLPGLFATYFDNDGLTGLAATRVVPNIDFDWGYGSPDGAIGADTFSARFVGLLTPTSTGQHHFSLASTDNAARVWVNGQLVASNWDGSPNYQIHLEAGQSYEFVAEYREDYGYAALRLDWYTPNTGSWQRIPASAFTFDPTTATPSANVPGPAVSAISRTLDVNATFGGNVSMRGGRVRGGEVAPTSAATLRFTETDSRFERVTLNGDMDLSNADRGDGYYGYLVVNGGLTLNGTLMVGTESRLRIEGDQAITTTSSGVILMDSVQDVPWYLSRIELAGDTTATIASGITIRQSRGYGYIGEGWYGSGGRGQRLINQGTIEVVSPGRALSVGQYMEGVTNASSGVLSASGARLEVHGLTGNVETLSVTGGSAEFYGGSYAINRPLTIPSGVDIAFGGSWTNASTITVNGGGLWIGTSNGEWYSRDQLGTIVRNGGTVTLRGTIDQDLPLPPTGLAINATASNFVILTWNDGSYNERGFAIERSTDGGATFAQIGTTAANVTRYADTTVAASTAYVYRVRAYNAYGSSTHSDSVAATTAASGTTSLPGLFATYFDNDGLTGLAATRVVPNIDFDWGYGSPDGAIGADTFSARFVGLLTPTSTGQHHFSLASTDNAARVWVNGQLVASNWDGSPNYQIHLEAGQSYEFVAEYREDYGYAALRLDWYTPNTGSWQRIPASAFTFDPTTATPSANVPGPAVSPISRTLDVNATFGGNVTMRAGRVRGGEVVTSAAATLRFTETDSRFERVTLNGDLDLSNVDLGNGFYGNLIVNGGLTLNGTLTLGTERRLRIEGDQAITTTSSGVILMDSNYDAPWYFARIELPGDTTMTISSGVTVRQSRGYGSIGEAWYGSSGRGQRLINQGTIEVVSLGRTLNLGQSLEGLTNAASGVLSASGGRLEILGSSATVDSIGTIRAAAGGHVVYPGHSLIEGGRLLSAGVGSSVEVRGDLLGSTTNRGVFPGPGTILFGGEGTGASPQLLEVMSADIGLSSSPSRGFVYGTLRLANNTRVRLVDLSDNSSGGGSEALYVDSLIVPDGTTLDLNGLRVYARAAQLVGTIVGGEVQQVADSGPLVLNAVTPGAIGVPGELDEWTFFGHQGRSVSILLNPGSTGVNPALSPTLRRVQATLIDPSGIILNADGSASDNAAISFVDVTLPTAGIYKLQVRAASSAPANTGNYTVGVWDVTADVAPVEFNRLAVGSIENVLSVDRWNFNAVAGQSVRFDLLGSSAGDATFSLVGPGGYAGFTDIAGDSPLLTLPAAGAYQLVARGNGSSVGAYSFRLDQTSLTDLPVGVTLAGVQSGSDSAQLYRIPVATPSPLLVRLEGASGATRNELFVRFGTPPTRADYTLRSDVAASADQTILVPNAEAGDWYVLVYGLSVPLATTFEIETVASSVIIREAGPDRSASGSVAPITIRGAGYRAGTTIELVDASNVVVVTASAVSIDSFTQLSAQLPLTGVAQGVYGLRVRTPDGATDVLRESFTVLPPGTPRLETRLVLPPAFGRHATATVYVEYANTGTVAMPAPLLRLQSADPDGSDRPILTLDHARLVEGFWTSGMPEGFSQSIQILASGASPGILAPGERFSVPVYYAGLLTPWDFGDTAVEMEIRIFDATNAETIPWTAMRDELRPPAIGDEAWTGIYGNLVSNVGSTWGDFVRTLSDNARYLGSLGHRVIDVGLLWGFELQQAVGFNPVRAMASAIDAAFDVPGRDVAFGRSYAVSLAERLETSIFGRGWSVPWLMRLETEPSGAVEVLGSGGLRRRFEPDTRFTNAYIAMYADTGKLRRTGSEHEIREQDGSRLRFGADGLLLWSEDPNGNRVTLGYSAGGLETLTHSTGPSITLTYNAAGVVESVADSIGRVSSFTYDPTFQYLLTATAPNGDVTTYAYDTLSASPRLHALVSVTAGGRVRSMEYDDRGRLVATSLSGGAERVAFEYDGTGRVSVIDATGSRSELDYDHRGLIGRVVDPLGHVATAEYGADRRVAKMVDPLGQNRLYTWCGCGSLTSVTNELGDTTRFRYEYVGPGGTVRRMTSTTDANGNVTRYDYDTRGNLVRTVYANGSIEQVGGHDAVGNALSFINRRGQTLSFQYDAAGRLTRQTFTDGSVTDFAYDTHGNLVTAAEPDGRVTGFTYDAANRLVRVAYPAGRFLDFTYDAFGRRSSMIDQSGFRVNYGYDAAGRMERLSDTSGTPFVQYAYDAAGRLSRKDNGNGTFTDYAYDAAGQLLGVLNRTSGGSVNSRFDYAYDALGRRVSMGTVDGVWAYGYDAAGQLTSAVFTPAAGSAIPAKNLQYAYDRVGNRVRTVENGTVVNYAANNLNQYTQVGGDVLVHDADGNLVSRSGPGGNATYAYDQQNRLVRVVTPDGTWEYDYDAFGNRVASTFNGQRTEFVLDPAGLVNVVGEYASAGTMLARFVHGLGLRARVDGSSGQAAYYDADGGGSVVGLTDATGAQVNRYAYDPFGGVISRVESLSNDFEFVGQFGLRADGSGLVHVRARFLDVGLGRFVSIDPLRSPIVEPLTYRYAYNSPLNYADINGLWGVEIGGFWAPVGAGLGVSALIGSDGIQISVAAGIGIGGGVSIGVSTDSPDGGGIGGFIDGEAGPIGVGVSVDSGGLSAGADIGAGAGGMGGVEMAFPSFCPWCPPPPPAPPPAAPGGDAGGDGDSGTSQSVDPNALYGPSGFGPQNFVAADALLPYRIEFENYGPGSVNEDGTPVAQSRWASAPAQRVVVTNSLSPLFDLSSFLFTGFGFGDVDVRLPVPAQSWRQIVNMTFNGKSFEVWFEADLDYALRQLRLVFQSIDPTTSLPPDVLTGFLPPEDGTRRGMGFATYTIRPVVALPTGTSIRNIALIQFDGQTFIATNQVDPLDPSQGTDPDKEALVTFDAGIPTSRVEALPARQSDLSFPVRWSGADDVGGSGVKAYDIYVSVDGGPFSLWKTSPGNVTEALYPGQLDRTYAFYSVAIDQVGHREAAPATADATTQIGGFGVSWDGEAADGLWTNPLNWTGNRVPAGADDVIIPAGFGTIHLMDAEMAVRSIVTLSPVHFTQATFSVGETATFNAATSFTSSIVSFGGLASFNAAAEWNGGSFGGPGSIRAAAPFTLAGPAPRDLTLHLTVVNTLAWTGVGPLLVGPGGEIELADGSILAAHAAASITLASGTRLLGGGTVRIEDEHSLTVTGEGQWLGTGPIVLGQGGLMIGLSASLSGAFDTGTGPGLRVVGGSSTISGTLQGGGGLTIEGGSLTLDGPDATVGSLLVTGGELTLIGRLNAASASLLTGTFTLDVNAMLVLAGDYEQGADGLLISKADAAGVSGRIEASGQASLDGTLRVEFLGGFDPAFGLASYEITVLDAAGLGGQFSLYDLPATAAGAMKGSADDRTVRVLFNVADFNADGGVDFADIDAFFLAFDGGELWADINGDGGVDFADIDAFFAWWEIGGR